MSRICMLAHSYFPGNPRVRLQAVSMAAAGHEVEMVCPRAPGEASDDTFQGVHVTRLGVSRDRSRGMLGYALEYVHFFVLAFRSIAKKHAERGFDVVVVHNIPEQLVYAAWPAKRKGASLVLDVHDPLPELFAEKFGLRPDSAVVRLLARFELACCSFVDHVFVATDPLRDRLVKMGYPAERITPILNSPQLIPQPESAPDPYVVVYHGSLVPRYALETVLRGLAIAVRDVPEIELHLFGSDVDDDYVTGLKRLAQKLGIDGNVAFNGYLSPLALRRMLSGADLGIVSMRRPSHIDLAYPMKLFEYVANGVPVLSVRTRALENLFADGQVTFYEESDFADLARNLARLARESEHRRSLPRREGALAPELSWPEMEQRYLAVVEQLIEATPAG